MNRVPGHDTFIPGRRMFYQPGHISKKKSIINNKVKRWRFPSRSVTVQQGLTDTARRVVATRPLHRCQSEAPCESRHHLQDKCFRFAGPFGGVQTPTTPRPNRCSSSFSSSSSRTFLNSWAGSVPRGPGRSKADRQVAPLHLHAPPKKIPNIMCPWYVVAPTPVASDFRKRLALIKW